MRIIRWLSDGTYFKGFEIHDGRKVALWTDKQHEAKRMSLEEAEAAADFWDDHRAVSTEPVACGHSEDEACNACEPAVTPMRVVGDPDGDWLEEVFGRAA